MPLPVKIRFILNILIVVIFTYLAWDALSFIRVSRYLPLSAGLAGAVLGIALLVVDAAKYRKTGLLKADEAIGDSIFAVRDASRSEEAVAAERDVVRRAVEIWAYLLAYVGLIALAGLTVGTAVWLVIVLRFLSRFSLLRVVVSVVAVGIALQLIRNGMNLLFPDYYLARWITLDF